LPCVILGGFIPIFFKSTVYSFLLALARPSFYKGPVQADEQFINDR
jgi:hypothetical protein